MVFKNITLMVSLLITLSGCLLWPYKRDFDCPVGQGVKCKSLYEISKMADRGAFGPKESSDSDDCAAMKNCSPRSGCGR